MRGNRLLGMSLCLVTAVTALTACATVTRGAARPATHLTTSGPAKPAAPRVSHPLYPAKLVATPCSSLTASDLTGLGVTRPLDAAHRDDNGTGCTWTSTSGRSVGVSWITANKNGLSDLYANQSTYGYWQPTTVADYPAVYGDPLGDVRSHGDCVLNVGINDRLVFFIQYERPLEPAQACPLAAKAATYVITNLEGGA